MIASGVNVPHSSVLCQEGSSRLHSEVPAEEMDRSPDGSSLPFSASCSRGALVSSTSFGEELRFSSAVKLVSRTCEIGCTSASPRVRCDVCTRVIWCFYKGLYLSCKCRKLVM